MKLNFQLFDNFKEAALRCDLEVIPGKGYHTIRLPNGRYIFCWTPLNKIWELFNYYEKQQWDRALNNLRDNFSDFHLEVGGDSIEDMNLVNEVFWRVTFQNDITANEIVEIINIMNDDEKFEKKLFWTRLQQSDEEAA
jgi:hypothetical protein